MRWLYELQHKIQQSTWLRILSLLILIVSVGSIVPFLVLASQRLIYPFELEWIEGASVDEIRWILDGHALYAEPVISFVPMVYNPLFFVLSALTMKILGVGFVAPRLVAVVSTLGCFILLYLIVTRISKNPIAGLLAASFYAACFRFAGAWMDIARPDSLFLCLILLAFFIGQRYPSRPGMMTSGLLFVSAYYTKQNALLIILIMAPISMICSRGRTWLQWLSALVSGILIFWVLDAKSAGWFSFYTFDMVTYHEKVTDLWFLWRHLVPKTWPALIVSLISLIAFLASYLKPSPGQKMQALLNPGLAGVLILSSWGAFLQRWTYDNGFMPACVGLGILLGLGFDQILKWTQKSSQSPLRVVVWGGTVFLLLSQFYLLRYSLLAQLPTNKDREAGEKFIADLSRLPGKTFVFSHGFVNHLAGKDTYLHSTAFADAVGHGSSPPRAEDNRWRREKVQQVFEQAITQQKFDWVIVDQPETDWLPYYLYLSPVFNEPNVFYPVTGAHSRPESLMIKNPVAQGGSFPLTDTNFEMLLTEGWSPHEDWGRWTMGRHSAMNMALETGHNYELAIQAFPFCPSSFEGQTLEAKWNDVQLGSYTFRICEEQTITFNIPSQSISPEFNILSFEFGQALSPAELGLSSDPRPLAVGFRSLSLVQR